jgi:hypothetical protein
MKRFVLNIMTAGMLLTANGVLRADDLIHDRKENQQDRIAQGVKSGSLTAGETANLERKESNLNKQIRAERQANGGNLTNNQKAQVNREQNRLSRNIYRDKHNGVHQ